MLFIVWYDMNHLNNFYIIVGLNMDDILHYFLLEELSGV